jgi:hypothetical protein
VERELRHEIGAYQDFCEFRGGTKTADPKKLEARRLTLQKRMRRKRRKMIEKMDAGSHRSPFRLW